jgi:hypothetical protein
VQEDGQRCQPKVAGCLSVDSFRKNDDALSDKKAMFATILFYIGLLFLSERTCRVFIASVQVRLDQFIAFLHFRLQMLSSLLIPAAALPRPVL